MNLINSIPFPVLDRSSESLISQGVSLHIWDYGNHINRQNEIIIGMSPTNYHCFLIANEIEYHPRFSFNKAKLTRPRRKAIRAGIFIRIKNLSIEQVLSFECYLKSLSQNRTRSCHLGVLEALSYGAGIQIKDNKSLSMTPKQFLTKIMKQGFELNHQTLEIEFNMIKPLDLEQVLEEVQYFQTKFKWAYLLSDLYYFTLTTLFPKKKLKRIE